MEKKVKIMAKGLDIR